MSKNYSITTILFVLVTLLSGVRLSGQSNNPAPYCMPIFTISPCNQPSVSNNPANTVNHFINSVITAGASTDIVNVNTGCNGLPNNYIYYCQPYLLTAPGQVITCSVQSGNGFSQSFALFVDWDQNNNFDLPAERLDASTSAPAAGSWFVMTFTVPAQQALGAYRMRIRSYFTSPTVLVDPCSPEAVGETEDYNLYIGNGSATNLAGVASVNAPLCAGQNINLLINHNGSSFTNFIWSGPGGFSNFTQNPVITNITPTMSGMYVVQVTDGACSITRSVNVTVSPNPTLTVNNPTVCAGTPAVITASGASSYSWGIGQNGPSVNVSPINTATFLVTGTTNSCSSSTTATVTVVPAITLSLSSTATLACAGTQVTLSLSGANSYTWSHGPTGGTVVVSPTISTTYSITGEAGPCKSEYVYNQLTENCSSIGERGSNGLVKLFPNPANNELNVEAPGTFEIRIYDVTGKLVYFRQSQHKLKVEIGGWPDGVYMLLVKSQNYSETLKIIKN